jgi:uncharacterized repeat protein (TIGR02543 family)
MAVIYDGNGGGFYNNSSRAFYSTRTTWTETGSNVNTTDHTVFNRDNVKEGNYSYTVYAPNKDFVGWNTRSDGYGQWAYENRRLFADCGISRSSRVTLYAIWKDQSVCPIIYTVCYDANGGTGAPGSQKKVQGSDLTLSYDKPTRDGYNFKGWATSKTGAVTYQPGGVYANNANITLYAVWEKSCPAVYTVSYDANGGTGAPASQVKTQGVDLYLSYGKPVRDGYDFLGWAMSSSATTPVYQPGGLYKSDASVTLYAVWKAQPPKTYTITYHPNGGIGNIDSRPSYNNIVKIESVGFYKVVDYTTYPFWFYTTNQSGINTERYYPGDTIDLAKFGGSVTLYAHYMPSQGNISGGPGTSSVTPPSGGGSSNRGGGLFGFIWGLFF